jgi:hypothetical protein
MDFGHVKFVEKILQAGMLDATTKGAAAHHPNFHNEMTLLFLTAENGDFSERPKFIRV